MGRLFRIRKYDLAFLQKKLTVKSKKVQLHMFHMVLRIMAIDLLNKFLTTITKINICNYRDIHMIESCRSLGRRPQDPWK